MIIRFLVMNTKFFSSKAKDNILKLIHADRSFALYRLPGESEPGLVLQQQGQAEQYFSPESLRDKAGFVLAPFEETKQHPILLIAPDIAVRGEEVNQALEEVEVDDRVAQNQEHKKASGARTNKQQREDYRRSFERFITPLKSGFFDKLVLSRSSEFELDKGFSAAEAFVHACARFPGMMVYLCHTPVSGTWMAITPEILLKRVDKQYETVALAGTMAVPEGETAPEWSEKNRREQAHVSDYIRRVIKENGGLLEEQGPFTARAGGLVHIKTIFKFCLKSREKVVSVVDALHPTPAVCGLPKEECFRFILENEGYDRSYYSGFVGPLSLKGRSDLYVNLRCARLEGTKAVLYAGGGLLPSSEEEAEWNETVEKMKTMLSILKEPNL